MTWGLRLNKLTDFVWNDFLIGTSSFPNLPCTATIPKRNAACYQFCVNVLENILKLLHPIIPFVTAEIYGYLPKTKGNINNCGLIPAYNIETFYRKEGRRSKGFLDLIKAVRAMKGFGKFVLRPKKSPSFSRDRAKNG